VRSLQDAISAIFSGIRGAAPTCVTAVLNLSNVVVASTESQYTGETGRDIAHSYSWHR
jgi:hypothetical protein